MRVNLLVAILLIFSLSLLSSAAEKVPFPEDVPLQHFSYFLFPVDVVGFMDSKEGAEITPEGNVYTGYTELIFLEGNPLNYFPLRRHYWLEKEYLPIIHWSQNLEGVSYAFSAFAAPLDLNPERNLIVFLKVRIENASEERRKPQFGLATRYLPPEAEGNWAPRLRFRRPAQPGRAGEYEQEGEEFSAIWNFEFRENSLLREGKALYIFSSDLEPGLYSYPGYKTEPEKKFKQPFIASSPLGLAIFSKELAPREFFEIEIKMPYRPIPFDSREFQEISSSNFSDMEKRVVDFWEDLLSQGMKVELPEQKPVNVYKTSLIYDLIARDRIGQDYIQKVNEFQYDAFWLRDSSFIVRSYDLGGYHDIARQCLDFFFKWQKEDGNFLSQGGQYDGWGQTLWAFGQHFRLTRDKEFGEKALPAVMKAVRWLENEMSKDPLGIMPVTTPGDNEDITGHVTGHNFWALAGLKNAIAMADGLGKKQQASELRSLFRKLEKNLLAALNKVLKQTGNYIPPGLENQGGQDWGNMMGVYPEIILPPHHPAISETLKRTRAKYREKLMTYGDTQYLHHYLTMKNTETWVVRGDREEALDEFYAILAHTSSTQAGFEFSLRPWLDRDFHGNLTPHGWFASKYRNLLRSMLIREEGDSLHLLSVVSPAWAKTGDRIAIKNSPTYFGKVSFTANFTDSGMDLEINPEFFHPPRNIIIHLPYFFDYLRSEKGRFKDQALILSAAEKKVKIKCKRREDVPSFSFESMVRWLKEEYRKR